MDVLIVGAGFAGAATAFHLSRISDASIVLVEREQTPGAHASGRNASLLRQSEADPEIRRAAVASRRAYQELSREIDFQQVGSLLLAGRNQLEQLREPSLLPAEVLEAREARRRLPALAGHRFDHALATPGDGVVDTWALLSHYLAGARSRGVELATDCEVLAVTGPAPYQVATSRGRLVAGSVVNAAGAWAPRIARLLGLEAALVPFKRHLFVLDGIAAVDPRWPFVWSLEHGFYFRPESGGLLFSVCDDERSEHLAETVSPGISEVLAERVLEQLPAFSEARIRSLWSCFRTKTPDGRFVIGWDPRQEGFFWVAGLGGHGMGCSWEIGRLAARIFCRRQGAVAAFDPARLVAAD